ncbi:MAG: response regulator [Kiritimatiellia bacterium]|nr:response regulator [Kiritimatiellia bacterium]
MEPKDIHILLVDDEGGFRRPMEFWLKAKGYQVTGVASGEEGLMVIAQERPSIVYLDMKMPGMNGIETLRKIREKDKILPVIMITAHGTPKDMEEAEQLGVSGFFRKDDDFATAAKLIVIALESSKIIQPEG